MTEKKKNKPVLTILIPVYNTEKYIEKCLNSLIDSRVENKIEVIIVSDGSKDNSINIAKKVTKDYSKTFSIIEKENGGHGSTINVGIKKATGKYFRVLDSDDWFDKNEFIKFVSKLEKCDSDLVITNYSKEYVNDGISETIKYNNLKSGKEYSFDNFDLGLLDNNFFAMATITYKTDILKKRNFQLPEKTFYVDMIYDVFPILDVNTFTYFDCNIYKYYIGRVGQSVNTSSFARNYLNHDKVTRKLIDFYQKNINVFNEIKKIYIKNIVKTIINTNYSIYCIFHKEKKLSYKNVKEFDLYLRNNSKELYKETNNSFIRIYRKTKFMLIFIIPNKLKMFIYKLMLNKKSKGGN